MTISANIPSPSAPLVDPKSGQINDTWWRFLVALFNRTGGTGNATDATTLLAMIASLQAQANDLSVPTADDINPALQSAFGRISDLESFAQPSPVLQDVLRRIDSLEAAAVDYRSNVIDPPTLNQYAPSSKTPNGWQKLTSGLLIQWGTNVVGAAGSLSVTYPIAFPTAVFSGSATPGGGAPAAAQSLGLRFDSITSMTIFNPGASAVTAYWMLIGA